MSYFDEGQSDEICDYCNQWGCTSKECSDKWVADTKRMNEHEESEPR